MPIFSIDAENCVNCGKCVKICPLDVLREGKTTPEIVYREDCQSCFCLTPKKKQNNYRN